MIHSELDRSLELTTCGDNGEIGIIVWLGTKNKRGATDKLHKMARFLCTDKAPSFKNHKSWKVKVNKK